MKRNECVDAISDELSRHGAVYLRHEQGRKHIRVFYGWNGDERFIVTSSSASDRRALENCRQVVRHVLGVVKKEKTVGERGYRAAKAAQAKASIPDALSVGRDAFSTLRRMPLAREIVAKQADTAWAQWFGAILAAHGHIAATPDMRVRI